MRWRLIFIFMGMGLATYLTRVTFTVLVPRRGVPEFWERFLEAIPLAALTALVAPAIWPPGQAQDGIIPWPALLGAAAALILARRRHGILAAAGLGTALFLLLTRFLGK